MPGSRYLACTTLGPVGSFRAGLPDVRCRTRRQCFPFWKPPSIPSHLCRGRSRWLRQTVSYGMSLELTQLTRRLAPMPNTTYTNYNASGCWYKLHQDSLKEIALFYRSFVLFFLCCVISCCSSTVFDPCLMGVLCISSYVLLSFVISCCSGICGWHLFYGCFAYLFLCLVSFFGPALCLTTVLRVFCVISSLVLLSLVISLLLRDPCFTGVSCISSYFLLSLVAPPLCLTPVLRLFCVSLLMSCYLSCCCGSVFGSCLTVVLCISSYGLLSILISCIVFDTFFYGYFALSLISCYLLLLRDNTGIVFDTNLIDISLLLSNYFLLLRYFFCHLF